MGLIQAKAQIVALEILIQSVAEPSDKWAENKVIRRPDGTFLRWDKNSANTGVKPKTNSMYGDPFPGVGTPNVGGYSPFSQTKAIPPGYAALTDDEAGKYIEVTSSKEYEVVFAELTEQSQKLASYQGLLKQVDDPETATELTTELNKNIANTLSSITALSLHAESAKQVYLADIKMVKDRNQKIEKEKEALRIKEEVERLRVAEMTRKEKAAYKKKQDKESKRLQEVAKINEFLTPVVYRGLHPIPDDEIVVQASFAALAATVLVTALNRRQLMRFIEKELISPNKVVSRGMEEISEATGKQFSEHIREVTKSAELAKSKVADSEASEAAEYIDRIIDQSNDFIGKMTGSPKNLRDGNVPEAIKHHGKNPVMVKYQDSISQKFKEVAEGFVKTAKDESLSKQERVDKILADIDKYKDLKPTGADVDDIPTVIDDIVDQGKEIPLVGFLMRKTRQSFRSTAAKTDSIVEKAEKAWKNAITEGTDEEIAQAAKDFEEASAKATRKLSQTDIDEMDNQIREAVGESAVTGGNSAKQKAEILTQKKNNILEMKRGMERKLNESLARKEGLENTLEQLKKRKRDLSAKNVMEKVRSLVKKTESGRSISDEIIDVEKEIAKTHKDIFKVNIDVDNVRGEINRTSAMEKGMEKNIEKALQSPDEFWDTVTEQGDIGNWIAKSSLPEPVLNALAVILRASGQEDECSLETSLCLQMAATGNTSICDDIVSLMEKMDIKITPEIITKSQELRKDKKSMNQLKIELISSIMDD